MNAKKRWTGRPTGRWVAARKVVQYLALLGFIAIFVLSRPGGWPLDLSHIPFHLDPLVVLSNWLASRVLPAGSALALIVIILTLVFGRAWCGWVCPLGTVLDLIPLRRKGDLARQPYRPLNALRRVKYGLLLTLLVAALLGNLTLLVFDPLTILFRTLTVSVWPPLDRIVTAVEAALYRIPFLADPISSLDAHLRPALLPSEPVFYRDAVLFAAVFVGVIALNAIAPRFWCRYLCPLGGLLGLVSKLALFRRQVGDECKGCTLCTNVCPTATIDPQKSYASDPSECTLCLDCLETCPRSLIAFNPKISFAQWNDYDPGRRGALLSIGLGIAGAALFRSSSQVKRPHNFMLRPPGALEANADAVALTKCVRCGACLRACPTGGLQPAFDEAGLAGMWTPILTPRLGYCDYSCNACGQVCPEEAIPPLGLEEKRLQIIGKAYIDEDRCIAWADRISCIVCEEMCPLPEKAIVVETVEIEQPDGARAMIQRPIVNRESCIGCGICEYKCPVSGEAAIRVVAPEM